MRYSSVLSCGDGGNPYLLRETRSSIDCRSLLGHSNIHHTCIRPWSSLLSSSSLGPPLDPQGRRLVSPFCPPCFCFGQIIPEYVKSRTEWAALAVGHRCEDAKSEGWWWNAHPGGDRRTETAPSEDSAYTPWSQMISCTASVVPSMEIELNLKAIPKVKIRNGKKKQPTSLLC